MSDNEQYLELIGRIAKIDIQAALYLRYEARELYEFRPDGYIGNCFYWDDTPQRHRYWQNIEEKLTNNRS